MGCIKFIREDYSSIVVEVDGDISQFWLSKAPRSRNDGWHLMYGSSCIASGTLRHVKAEAAKLINDDLDITPLSVNLQMAKSRNDPFYN